MVANSTLGFSQACDPSTPSFIVDLRGKSDSAWVSSDTSRSGHCCGATNPDRCIEFMLYLDTNAEAINFKIGSGAIPPGALFYQIGCGGMYQVGEGVCLSGVGPHRITFCKPGNNPNSYIIESIPKPSISDPIVVGQGCSNTLSTMGMVDSTINWTSVPYNATYNTYLSCTTGCNTVVVTGQSGSPAFVDYQVCGSPISSCSSILFCDTVRVSFIDPLVLQVPVDTPAVCFGNITTTVTVSPSGGLPPYIIAWSTGDSTSTVNLGPGTYTVTLDDSTDCPPIAKTIVVKSFSSTISVNAGNDSTICDTQFNIPLNGSVQAASDGIWSGGLGTYSPNNSTLNANYSPSQAEIDSGFFTLILTSTGNGSCPEAKDSVSFQITLKPSPQITGPPVVCEAASPQNYSTPAVPGNSYSWSVIGGIILSGNGTNAILVQWTSNGSVSLTESNGINCDSTVSINIIISQKPIPNIVGSNFICNPSGPLNYSSSLIPGNTYVWSVNGGTILSGNGTQSISVQWTTSGTVFLTESNSLGCDSSVSLNVTVAQKPSPEIIGPEIICEPSKLQNFSTLFVSGNTYSWTVIGGSILSGNGTNSIWVQWISNGSVQLTESSGLNCDSTVSLNVVLSQKPTPIINGVNSICAPPNNPKNYTTISNPGNTYLWTITGGTIISGNGTNSIMVQWTSSGTITLTETNSLNCDSTVAMNFTFFQKPNPAILGNSIVCSPSGAQNYSTTLVSGNTYSWVVTGGNILSGIGTNSIWVQWVSSGNVQLTESINSGCDSTVSLNVIVSQKPSPVLIGDNSICSPPNNPKSYSTVLNPGNSYQWTVNGGNIISGNGTNSIIVQWITSGSVSLTETNSLNCDSTVSVNFTFSQIPTPAIIGTNLACNPSGAQNYSTTLVPGNTYSWLVNGGNILSGNGTNSIWVQWVISGNVQLTESSSPTCDSTVSLSVIVSQKPAPFINGDNSNCSPPNNPKNYSTILNPGNSYQWLISGGNIISGNGTNSIMVQWVSSGTISLTEKNSLNCDSTVSINFAMLQKPSPSLTGPSVVCDQAIPQNYTTPFVAGNTYLWSIAGGNIVSGNGTNAVSVQWIQSSGNISLTELNNAGCDSTISLIVNSFQKPRPLIYGSSYSCNILTVPQKYYTLANTGNTYSWVISGGNILSGFNTNSIMVQWTGNGTIKVTETTAEGCQNSDDLVFNSNPMAGVNIAPLYKAGCSPLKVEFFALNPSGNYLYDWDFGDGKSATIQNPVNTYTNAGEYQAKLIISFSSCKDTLFSNIKVFSSPKPDFIVLNTRNDTIYDQEPRRIKNITPGINTYLWNFDDRGGSDTSTNPIHTFYNEGEHFVSLTASTQEAGCVNSITKMVYVLLPDFVYVPDIFTPNGDGNNDYFDANTQNIKKFSIYIFNRWGEEIYHSVDPHFKWDGKHKGVDVINGAYVYYIDATSLENRIFKKVGLVVVAR